MTDLSVTPMLKKIVKFLLVLSAAAGICSVVVVLREGGLVTALTSSVPWGMWVVFYIYFVGLSAGSFLISTLVYVFGVKKLKDAGPLAYLAAIVALLTGMVFIWIDLGHPLRIWKIVVDFNPTSILAWEVLLYGLYLVVLLLCFWFLKRCDLSDAAATSEGAKKRALQMLSLGYHCPSTKAEYDVCHTHSLKIVKALSIVGMAMAIGVRGGTGALFAVVAARPHWFSGLLPLVFLISGLFSASAMLLFVYSIFADKRDEQFFSVLGYLKNLLVLFLAIEFFLLVSECLVGTYSQIPERLELYRAVLFGPFPYIFWIGQLILGAAVPLFLCLHSRTRNNPFWLAVAGFSASCGVVSLILNLVIPAYVFPMLKGLDTAFMDKRLAYFYFPGPMEWLSSVGLVSLTALVFTFLLRQLPILTHLEKKLK